MQLPIIDISDLETMGPGCRRVAGEIGEACRTFGFFYIVGHGVDERLQARLRRASRRFFACRTEEKMNIRMARGGKAWRGYFPFGSELTSGVPDRKEGLYFGSELGADDARVWAGLPLHGANLFPEGMPELRSAVLSYIDAMTRVGHRLMAAIAMSLGLEPSYMAERYTADPLILFRIFHYPPQEGHEGDEPSWGVGEHTDYGVLTILQQDDIGGLQVKSRSQWIEAPPIDGSFVCNIGDMLDRMTRGVYRSTPHRVVNVTGKSRYSFPFFFDPSFNARIEPIESCQLDAAAPIDDRDERWDRQSVHTFEGTYGDYILHKVAKVFPELSERLPKQA